VAAVYTDAVRARTGVRVPLASHPRERRTGLNLALIKWLNRALLALSIVTVFGAIAGSHSFLLFK
jgi:hypothetical protein